MKKVTDFIVNRRYIILMIFIILTIISVFVSKNVKINNDMTKYLPKSSETRIGMDIMEAEFDTEENSSLLNLMFKNIGEEEKQSIYKELQEIEGVSQVDYDETENYNKDGYTLYVINVDEPSDSEIAERIYNEITEKYENYDTQMSGSIVNSNTEVLPTWIIVVAVLGAFIILIFMCESYIEPVLFLLCILIAVLLNSGTNIIFDSVSIITSSISAILQMALSMDYSIMLMDRFRQEKEKQTDKVEAMKEALYHAFSAISSSSVTTIVGLIALVFMSFTIGKDLGLVLAKGVLLSLLSIFFVLPSLILICDKLITKTQKRSPDLHFNKVGSASHKIRYVLTIAFFMIFVTAFLLKGSLNILYTDSELNEIAKVFGENNQMGIVYNTKDEEKISKYLSQIEDEGKVDEVLAYGNTINEKQPADGLVQKIKDLGEEVEIKDYLLKILYYKYFNPNESNTMTFDELVKFVQNEVYNNQEVNDMLSQNIRNDVDRLSNFTDKSLINKGRTSNEIAKILGVETANIDDILIYYNSKNNNQTLTLNEFANFVNSKVLTDLKYGGNFDTATRQSIANLLKFTNTSVINKKMSSKEMANLFGMSEENIQSLYTYNIALSETSTKMSISQFADFILTDVITNEQYANLFDETTINQIKMLSTFSNTEIVNMQMTADKIAELFGINEQMANAIIQMKYMQMEPQEGETVEIMTMSPFEFVNLILNNLENEMIKSSLDETQISTLMLAEKIMESANTNQVYSYEEMAGFTGVDVSSVKNIYTLYDTKTIVLTLTPNEFVQFVLAHMNDEALKNSINASTSANLKFLQTVMQSALAGTKYSSSSMSNFLNMDKSQMDLLYGLYVSKNNPNQRISLNTLINFMLDDVINNKEYSSKFDEGLKSKLGVIRGIMKASFADTKYTKDEIIGILNNLSDELEDDTIEILYLYYGSVNEYDNNWEMTVEEFINFLNDDILTDTRFEEFIDENMRNNIENSKKTIEDAKKLLVGEKHSRIVINTKYELEGEETYNFIQKLEDIIGQDVEEFYIIGDSPMAYEMSKTFGDEFNNISILTMIMIFVVVAITFKSILIPIILVGVIQCAVYMTMGILSISGGSVFYLSLLIVQSILMGSTIDYAILYTSYYLESRTTMNKKESVINAYNEAINTILTSALILIIVTFVVGSFATDITAKICKTLSEGTLCSAILILVFLPGILATFDKWIIKKDKK